MTARVSLLLVVLACHAADWPEWRGKGRAGVWSEDGILEQFSASGLRIKWRTPVRSGFSGPAVAGGRVFVLDYLAEAGPRGTERAMALDETTGKLLWTREWAVNTTGLSRAYAVGPRATPTVDGDYVYTLGAMGKLHCLKAATGEVVWDKDYAGDFKTAVPVWGMTGSPLVIGERLVLLAGGAGNAMIVALDKRTGRELWRAIDSTTEPGYSPPIFADGKIITWHPAAVSALQPATGEVLWSQPFKSHLGLSVVTPVVDAGRLLISSFYNGSMMLQLGEKPRMLWKGSSASEIDTDGLHSLISTPVIDGDYVYGICSYGQLRCLNAKTGERVWETLELTQEKARWSAGLIVRHKDRYFVNTDRGDLVIARFTPQGYQEISRTRLIRPTSTGGIGRREMQAVNWSHPAYANRHIFARNDEEIIRASLERE